jgi:hypothetical protein
MSKIGLPRQLHVTYLPGTTMTCILCKLIFQRRAQFAMLSSSDPEHFSASPFYRGDAQETALRQNPMVTGRVDQDRTQLGAESYNQF